MSSQAERQKRLETASRHQRAATHIGGGQTSLRWLPILLGISCRSLQQADLGVFLTHSLGDSFGQTEGGSWRGDVVCGSKSQA